MALKAVAVISAGGGQLIILAAGCLAKEVVFFLLEKLTSTKILASKEAESRVTFFISNTIYLVLSGARGTVYYKQNSISFFTMQYLFYTISYKNG